MLVRGHNSTLYVGSWAKFYAKNDCDEFATKIATELHTRFVHTILTTICKGVVVFKCCVFKCCMFKCCVYKGVAYNISRGIHYTL